MRILFYISWFLVSSGLLAQENMGLVNSNYVPASSIFLNPTASADSKVFIDFNVVGISSFVQNNYAYLPTSLSNFNSDINEPLYNRGNAPYNAFTDVNIQGPSISLSVGKLGVGLFTNIRSNASVNGLPEFFVNHITEGFDLEDQLNENYTLRNLRLGALNWLEYGANFSYIVQQKGTDMITVGGNLKLLSGIAGAGLNVQEWNYEVENDSLLNSFSFRGEYGLSDLNTDGEQSGNFLGNGFGLGVDLGFGYKKMKKSVNNYRPHTTSGCNLKEYRYKFGFSLLDLGRIGFGNGFYRDFQVEDSLAWQDYGGANPEDLEEIDQLIDQELISGANTNGSAPVRVLLPSAFSAQFDYNFGYGLYANASLVHGFGRKNRLGVERSSSLVITPRFESKPVDVALPISLLNYQKVRMGLAFRVYYLTIGTDNLFSLVGSSNTFGTDFYFSLRYIMFRPWYCDKSSRKSSFRKTKGRGGKPCPTW